MFRIERSLIGNDQFSHNLKSSLYAKHAKYLIGKYILIRYRGMKDALIETAFTEADRVTDTYLFATPPSVLSTQGIKTQDKVGEISAPCIVSIMLAVSRARDRAKIMACASPWTITLFQNLQRKGLGTLLNQSITPPLRWSSRSQNP